MDTRGSPEVIKKCTAASQQCSMLLLRLRRSPAGRLQHSDRDRGHRLDAEFRPS
jgi:hypothetical protein